MMRYVFLLQYDKVEHSRDEMDKKMLQNIQEELCRFIMREVIHQDGAYHDRRSVTPQGPQDLGCH